MPSGSSAQSKEECLSRVVPLGEAHLRLLVGEYVEHYHRERNHQGLDNQLLQRPPPPVSLAADVQRRARLGGLLNFYHREATGVVGRLNAPYALEVVEAGLAHIVQNKIEAAYARSDQIERRRDPMDDWSSDVNGV